LRSEGTHIRVIAKQFGVAYYTVWKTLNGINHAEPLNAEVR
jgi:hypothetical protein